MWGWEYITCSLIYLVAVARVEPDISLSAVFFRHPKKAQQVWVLAQRKADVHGPRPSSDKLRFVPCQSTDFGTFLRPQPAAGRTRSTRKTSLCDALSAQPCDVSRRWWWYLSPRSRHYLLQQHGRRTGRKVTAAMCEARWTTRRRRREIERTTDASWERNFDCAGRFFSGQRRRTDACVNNQHTNQLLMSEAVHYPLY